MKKLNFRYASAKNFMCFGPDGIEIFFENLGNLICIRGLNKDTGGSNGAGKSSIFDIMSYALYGKTVKEPKLSQDDVINTKHAKRLDVVFEFDDIRIQRCREPNRLKVWQSKDHVWDNASEVTRGTMSETQKFIESQIGFSHSAFCNIVVFDDSNKHCFLELDAAGKRHVVENLLGLEKYREYHENAKEWLKIGKLAIKELTTEYDRFQDELAACDARIQQIQIQETSWTKTKQSELDQILVCLSTKETALSKCDSALLIEEYNLTQKKIAQINEQTPVLETKREKMVAAIADLKTKVELTRKEQIAAMEETSKISLEIGSIKNEIANQQKVREPLQALKAGQPCPVCHGEINTKNYQSVIDHANSCITKAEKTLEKQQELSKKSAESMDSKIKLLNKITDTIKEAEKKLGTIDDELRASQKTLVTLSAIRKPDLSSQERVLESEIEALKLQRDQKNKELTGASPYVAILDSAVKDRAAKQQACDEKVKVLRSSEAELPYLEFWVTAFGDRGIRRYVIEGIIPALNARIAYWMQYLIDAKIELTFDNELTPTIKRLGTLAEYRTMSNGEKRRINLAVSQAFAYVMMLNSGNCPSVVFLDEITGGGIDAEGVIGVYNMIFELAKERQVFVTTHNKTLLDMLQGCKELVLVKENDITKMAA